MLTKMKTVPPPLPYQWPLNRSNRRLVPANQKVSRQMSDILFLSCSWITKELLIEWFSTFLGSPSSSIDSSGLLLNYDVLQVVLLLKLRSLQRRSALPQRVAQTRQMEEQRTHQRPRKEMKLTEMRQMMKKEKKKIGERRRPKNPKLKRRTMIVKAKLQLR